MKLYRELPWVTLNKIQQGVMIDQQQQQMADFLFCFKKHL